MSGNAKRAFNFLPSAPSLKEKLRGGNDKFKTVAMDTLSEPIQFQPRNGKQLTYFKSSSASGGCATRDSFCALHELAYIITGFIWTISTYPDLVVTCGSAFFTTNLPTASIVMLSYDTTFNLGDFYVSVLMAQTNAFSETPTFPIAFLIHERKFEATHVSFFTAIKKILPASFTPIIVTDGEKAVINAIRNVFPSWTVISCWNHILTDVEVWLKARHITLPEISVYKSTMRELLQCCTPDEYTAKYHTVSATWTTAFKEYYDQHLVARVQCAYTGYLASVNFPHSSVTNNISESFNHTLKRHQDWREVSVDAIVMVLYRLQLFYRGQIVRSIRGFGPYTSDATNQCSKFTLSSV